MTNYDYNRGYRGFKFKKDLKIDSKLPALKTYLSERQQTTAIRWLRNPAQQELPHCNTIDDVTSSIVYFPRVGTTLTGQLPRKSRNSGLDEDSMEGLVERYLLPIPTTAISKRDWEDRKTPHHIKSLRLPREIKQRYLAHKRKLLDRTDLKEIKRNEQLKQCLVIQNGVERGKTNDLLTNEKKNDIMDWVDKIPLK